MTSAAWVTVRDSRFGGDPARVTEDGGEVLAEFESPRLHDEADLLTLPGGTEVKVLGVKETHGPRGAAQVLSVGDVRDEFCRAARAALMTTAALSM